MKKFVLAAVAAAMLAPVAVSAQTISPYAGWKWGGSMGTNEGDLSAEASPSYGVEIAIPARPGQSFILIADYQPTTLRLQRFNGPDEDLFDLDIWYFMAGGQAEVPGQSRAVPFGSFALGWAWFNPQGAGATRESESMFTSMFSGGVRVPLGNSEKVMLKLEARIHLNVPYGGTGLYCGPGGCYGGVGGYVGPIQGAVNAGLSFAMGGRPGAGSRRR
jgi:opacity protein-like surface antigen